MIKDSLNKSQSESIDVLRFPLLVLVVFVHMLPFEQQALTWSFNSKDLYKIVSETISHHIGRLAVPCFFLFSGYFFFFKITTWEYKTYFSNLKKRINSIAIPYVAWNSLALLAVFLKLAVFQLVELGADEDKYFLDKHSVIDYFWTMPINFPLWYLRDLMVMILISPLFYCLFRYTKVFGLCALAIMYLLQIEFHIPGLSTTALFFFGLGAFLGLFKYNMLMFVIPYGKLSWIITLIALSITVHYTAQPENELWTRIFVVSGLITILYLGFLITKFNALKERLLILAKPVFFIYALHLIYILGWFKGAFAKSFLAHSGWGMILGYFTIPFLCIGVILLLYKAMEKFFPRVLGFLTGNRIIKLT